MFLPLVTVNLQGIAYLNFSVLVLTFLCLFLPPLFSFSYALLIVLNRFGMFTILLTHDDENRLMFFNRAYCFKYLNKINPSFVIF